jgi:tetratricopeptide (TPR) repeat protein
MAFSSEIEKLERRWQENPLGLTFAPLAEAYRKAGDTARALELLEQGLTQHPNYVPAHIVRGRCHLDAQSDPDAELAFLRVTELDPENVIALKGLAELSERAGRIPEAVHRLELLLDVDRNNEEARGQLDRVKELLANPPARASVPAGPATEPRTPVVTEKPESAGREAPEPVSELPESFDDISLDDLELEVASQLSSVPSDEFEIANDSEDLQPSDQRIADIVLGAESPEEIPIHERAYGEHRPAPDSAAGGMDSVDVLLGEDEHPSFMPPPPASEAEPMMELESAPEGVMEVESPSGSEWVELEPAEVESIGAPAPEAVVEPSAVPKPEPEPEPEPVAAESGPAPIAMVDDYVALGDLGGPTRFQPAAPQAEEQEPANAAEPELVVTETMAEIFLRQGHRELALAVYAQLAQREPENERIAAALARLTPEPSLTREPAPEPSPRFAASDTGGRSVAQLFGPLLAAVRPTVASTVHPPAFEPPKRGSGEPTRPAQESLSLSSVFGEESTPSAPAGTAADSNAGEPSFDEFFAPATGPAADLELPRTPESDTGGMPSQVPEDLEQFNAWLRGLKR